MTTLAIKYVGSNHYRLFWAIVTVVATVILLNFGITLNQGLALFFTAVVLTIWTNSKVNGLIAAVILFMVKPLFMRIAYDFDKNITGSGGFDLLGITPALLLAGLIIWHLYFRISGGENILVGRTRQLMLLFCAIAFLSIFNPANSIIVGFGGFERNILPNMMVMLLASFVFKDLLDVNKLLKILLLVGLVSCVYGIGQYLLGLYPWEKDWIFDVAFKESSGGWMTIGLRGIEFRVFSIFYHFTEFTFINAFIFCLAVVSGPILTDRWRKVRLWYLVLWFVLLIVTLERMPMVMCLVGLGVIYYLRTSRSKRRKVIWYSLAAFVLMMISLNIAAPFLKQTGAHTLIRLAEMTNPLRAQSIDDRMNRMWVPAINTISSHPLGVGIGQGSHSRAYDIVAKSEHWVDPHNELLQKALETGVVGALIFLCLLISVFNNGRILSRRKNEIKALGVGFVAGTVGFWLSGMLHVIFNGAPGLLYWTVAGVVLSMSESDKLGESHAVKNLLQGADKISNVSTKEENAHIAEQKRS